MFSGIRVIWRVICIVSVSVLLIIPVVCILSGASAGLLASEAGLRVIEFLACMAGYGSPLEGSEKGLPEGMIHRT